MSTSIWEHEGNVENMSRRQFLEFYISPFGTERWKFPYHLVNLPVSSRLPSAKNNYGKSNCKRSAPPRSVGLLILEKPLPFFNIHLNQFLLANGKYPKFYYDTAENSWTYCKCRVYRGYYTVARRYEFYVRVARTISHEWAQRTSEILFLPLEHKIHIFELTCNVLFIT